MFYDAITNIIARSIALVAPGYAREYLRNHRLCRAYEAAKNTGPNRNFRPAQASGAQEIEESWQKVTDKTRALVRDNSHVAGMTRRFVAALVGEGSWPRPKIIDFLQKTGPVEESEMFRVFNMGIGYVVIVAEDFADAAARLLISAGEKVYNIGHITEGTGKVVLKN